mgnify:CR=1 FL=1
MRTLLIVLDGAGDKLNNIKTPLQKANIPNLNYLASNGLNGIMYTVSKNIAPESDIAVMSILGYNPFRYHTGRGPLEMYGSNINFKNFTALRANFATIKNNLIVDRRAGRNLTAKEGKFLAQEINKKIKLKVPFIFKHYSEHRGILIFKRKLPCEVSNTDPSYERLGKLGIVTKTKILKLKKCITNNKKSKTTADLINDFTMKSRKILENHPVNKNRIKNNLLPANVILTRDAGNSLPKLNKKKNWSIVAGMPLEIGLSKLAGFKILKFKYPEMKSRNIYHHLYENLNKTINEALKYVKKENNSIYIHFKETDIPGHDGLYKEKVKMLELLDKKFFSKIKSIKNTIIIVTADHSTPCKLKQHSSDPVPVLVYGKGKDNIQKFNEYDCKKGSLGTLIGYNLLKTIQNL